MAWVRSCRTAALFVLLAAPAAHGNSSALPLKRLRLYETGVGYFERSGTLGSGAVTLPVPASHLDDALKTLVVFAGDGPSEVSGVEFGSSVSRSMASALAGLGSEQGRLGLLELLASLKGAAVEFRVGKETITGRLVEVLDAQISDLAECVRAPDGDESKPCRFEQQPTLVLLSRTGELRRFKAKDVASVRPTDPAFAARLGAALDALSDGSARVVKELSVLARAGKTLSIGYVSETPVWRASYRLVLGGQKDRTALLQGWALVHNDTDEPWRGVSVELVNGRPDSFLFPLAQPRYERRELVTPDNPLSTVPQLMLTTPDALWNTDAAESYGSAGLGLSGVGEGGGGRGEGIGLGSIGTLGAGSGGGDAASGLLAVGNLAAVRAAEGVESGALFRYALGHALDLRAHGSALVPFLGEGVSARRISLFDSGRARSGVYLVHKGQQTLPAGTLAVFGEGGFSGETALPRLKPEESTSVEFGFDLDVEDKVREAEQRDEPKLLRFANRTLVEHYVRRRTISHYLENRSGSERDVFVALDLVNNAEVKGAEEIVYDSQKARAYAVFRLAARASAERTLSVVEGLSRTHAVRTLTRTRLASLAGAPGLPEAQRNVLHEAIVALAEADARLALRAAAQTELELREAEAARFREHARGLGAAGERLVERLLAAEDQAQELRRKIRAFGAESFRFSLRATRALERLGT
jgi:hypothetical protein